MNIGETAGLSGLPPKTIRYIEKKLSFDKDTSLGLL
jgi:DNA-binding transcriptional MerR regulator